MEDVNYLVNFLLEDMPQISLWQGDITRLNAAKFIVAGTMWRKFLGVRCALMKSCEK